MYPDDIAGRTTSRGPITCRPREHRDFYNRQRFTLNVTRADMIRGRLFAQRAPVRGRRLRHADHQ